MLRNARSAPSRARRTSPGAGQVALDEADLGWQLALGPAGVADERDDLVALAGDLPGQVTADGAGGSGDEDLHVPFLPVSADADVFTDHLTTASPLTQTR
jgi:hypothetical protein